MSAGPLRVYAAWTPPQNVPMGASLSRDEAVRFVDSAPPIGTILQTDLNVKFVDPNGNNQWDQGETVVYDGNANGVYDPGETVIAGISPTPPASVRYDSRVKIVDTNYSTKRDPGETVVYDANTNNAYDLNELVIAGTPPTPQSTLSPDSRFKYADTIISNNLQDRGEPVVYETVVNNLFDAMTDSRVKFVDNNPANNVWDNPEPVVQDNNSNNLFDTNEPVLYGSTPSPGTPLRSDSKIRYVDSNRSGAREQGEAVIHDANSNGKYDTNESVILRASPAFSSSLTSDSSSRIKYSDTNNNNAWTSGEPTVYDSNANNVYDASTDNRIKFFDQTPDGHWTSGDPVALDVNLNGFYDTGIDIPITANQPPSGEEIVSDPKFRIVDSNRNGAWASGEPIIYDSDLNNQYNSGDTVIVGQVPVLGTFLSELVISGSTPAVGSVLKLDQRIRFVDNNQNTFWEEVEALVYDADNDFLFDASESLIIGHVPAVGTLLTEPIVSFGSVSFSVGATLKSDQKLRYVDSNANTMWNYPEHVAYDSDNDSSYDLGERTITGGSETSGIPDTGEVVVYDTNGNAVYDPIEPVIVGSAPNSGTALSSDPKVKFIDANNNAVRDGVETVVYDSNNDDSYTTNEPVIYGAQPPVKLTQSPSITQGPLGRLWLVWNEKTLAGTESPDVFYRTWTGTQWTSRQQVTTHQGTDNANYVTALENNSIMIVWSSDRTGNPELFYKLYDASTGTPTPTTGDIQITSHTLIDESPSAAQDRYGRIWIVWARQQIVGTSTLSDIYYKYYNGTVWSQDFTVPSASSPTLAEFHPHIAQTKDGRIRITYASNDTGNLRLFYTSTDGNLETLPSNGIPPGSWAAETQLPFGTDDTDDNPNLVQSRDGNMWLFFKRTLATGTDPSHIYYSTSANNGVSWSGATQLTNDVDSSPAAAQVNNQVWLFWNRPGDNTLQIWYSKLDPPITNIHDIGIRTIVSTPKFLKSESSIQISVKVANYGDFPETTQLTVKLNTTTVATETLNLAAGQTLLRTYTYVTGSQFWGRYIPTATLQSVTGESSINQADNSLAGGLVRIAPRGDVDNNGTVNILDIAIVAYSFGTQVGDPLYNPVADLDPNGVINILDVAIAAYDFGKSV